MNDYSSRISWGSVRNKKLQALMICDYVLDLQKQLQLSMQQTKDLKDFIVKGILLKYINSKDVILNMEGTKIDEIEGINLEERLYENRSYNNVDSSYITNTSQYQYFYSYWYQYLYAWNKISTN